MVLLPLPRRYVTLSVSLDPVANHVLLPNAILTRQNPLVADGTQLPVTPLPENEAGDTVTVITILEHCTRNESSRTITPTRTVASSDHTDPVIRRASTETAALVCSDVLLDAWMLPSEAEIRLLDPLAPLKKLPKVTCVRCMGVKIAAETGKPGPDDTDSSIAGAAKEETDTQTRSLVAVAGKDSNSSELQTRVVLQTRFVVDVGTTDWYCTPEHVVSATHSRLLEYVGAFVSYCIAVHVSTNEHSRSLVVVGARDSYCSSKHGSESGKQRRSLVEVAGSASNSSELHVVRTIHCRSDVVVGVTDWNCIPLHVVSMVHCRSDVAVGATDWYCSPLHVVKSLHTRSEVDVDARD
jgi:hypothetical protein